VLSFRIMQQSNALHSKIRIVSKSEAANILSVVARSEDVNEIAIDKIIAWVVTEIFGENIKLLLILKISIKQLKAVCENVLEQMIHCIV